MLVFEEAESLHCVREDEGEMLTIHRESGTIQRQEVFRHLPPQGRQINGLVGQINLCGFPALVVVVSSTHVGLIAGHEIEQINQCEIISLVPHPIV